MFTTNLSESASSAGDYPLFAPTVVPAAPRAAAVAPARRDDTALADVLRHPGIWRRGTARVPRSDALPTGVADLDALLPGGGWPRGALSEILVAEDGLGECSLLLPAL